MPTMKKAPPMADPQPNDSLWQTIWTIGIPTVTGAIGTGIGWILKGKEDERVDKAKAEHIATLVDRIDDTETRLNAMTAAHRDCEKNHATLAGRVGALESQAAECFEDRKVLREELRAIQRGERNN
jgi:hypothetical protein